ncbi:N-acetyltransferase [uncultured Sphingomonas sp.]|uniref:GNAT family N-acetyltransferase n=1 Tax=uncultured Sphingomonas sp. TaxID=158754 RepID=UPI00261B47DD|nr:N-acetyltransferase [uncultured Sphingomonas sp.]
MVATSGAAGAHLVPVETVAQDAVEQLLDLAFGQDRHGRTAYRLRDGVVAEPRASCAALDEAGLLVGSLQSWPLALTGADGLATPLWLVGPIAVHPDRRSEGIGRAMLRRALGAIDRSGIPAVLIGDAPYYEPFGFAADQTQGWQVPGPVDHARLLARTESGTVLPLEGMLGPRHSA